MKTYSFEIVQDEHPLSPREIQDNLTKIVCFHRRYDIGDKHDYRHSDYSSWDEFEKAIKRNEDVVVIEPLFMYEHSGVTISTNPFTCTWDSGQIGFVYITRKQVNSLMGYKVVTQKRKAELLRQLKNELKKYDTYLSGNVCGYKIIDDETGEIVDSCWGYYDEEYCKKDAKTMLEYLTAKDNVLIG